MTDQHPAQAAPAGCPSCDHDLSYPGAPGHKCYTYEKWRARAAADLATPDHGHDPAALLARAEKAEAERDEWRRRRDRAVEQCQFLHQDGKPRQQWHLDNCGAMRRAVELEAERDAALAALARVEAAHEPVEVWEYDDELGALALDTDGNRVLITRLCGGCSSEEALTSIEDCEWQEGRFPEVAWPCLTVEALRAATGKENPDE